MRSLDCAILTLTAQILPAQRVFRVLIAHLTWTAEQANIAMEVQLLVIVSLLSILETAAGILSLQVDQPSILADMEPSVHSLQEHNQIHASNGSQLRMANLFLMEELISFVKKVGLKEFQLKMKQSIACQHPELLIRQRLDSQPQLLLLAIIPLIQVIPIYPKQLPSPKLQFVDSIRMPITIAPSTLETLCQTFQTQLPPKTFLSEWERCLTPLVLTPCAIPKQADLLSKQVVFHFGLTTGKFSRISTCTLIS